MAQYKFNLSNATIGDFFRLTESSSSVDITSFIRIVADFDLDKIALDELPQVIKDFSEFIDIFHNDIKQAVDTILLVRKAQEIANSNE